MKTIMTSLPVYDKLNKQLYYRAKADEKGLMALVTTPRHRLPSMQWNVTEDTGALSSIKLVNISTLAETEIRTYFLNERLLRPSTGVAPISDLPTNGGYDVFTNYVGQPEKFAIQKTTAAGVAYVQTCAFNIDKGESMIVRFTVYTYTSGTPPEVVIVNASGTDISNTVRLTTAGTGYFTLTATEAASAARVRFRNLNGELVNLSVTYFLNSVTLPGYHTELTDYYYQYDGEPMAIPLPVGRYYLKMTTIDNYVFYSEVFEVTCVYPNLITTWTNDIDPYDYETFTVSGASIINAINSADEAIASGDAFTTAKDEVIYAVFYITLASGALPKFVIVNTDTGSGTQYDTQEGLNFITMIAPGSGNTYCYFYNSSNTQFSTFEVLIFRAYSEDYLRIDFSNSCDLGEFVYQNGWTQSVWIKSEPMETTFPIDDKGVEDGEGRFIRTFARQIKKYSVKTLELPDFMVDVFHRMRLHDDVELTDLVGDTNEVYNLEVENEWLWDDKYYAQITLTFDYNEVFVVAGCCNNLT